GHWPETRVKRSMMQLEPIVSAQAEELSAFAHPIWMEVFGPMLPGGHPPADERGAVLFLLPD
ncbi:MAG: hypothetical protein PHI87_01535, partial [Candidatus Methanomethylophilus sp.]|nr:hypothetical protein [Methanomethylophilus sp.]